MNMTARILTSLTLMVINMGVVTLSALETESPHVNWFNLQWPPQANIAVGGSVTLYARCYEDGITTPAGQDARISVWFGYSTDNTNPKTWTNWKSASFNFDYDGVDEYFTSLGSSLPEGIYYYASRIQYDGGSYQYGGYNANGGGFWDGSNFVSGILAVGKTLATITLGNTLQVYDGNPKQITAVTDPVGMAVQVTYNGSATLPVNPGTYKVIATVIDAFFQGTATGSLSIYETASDASIEAWKDKFIWTMFDQVYNQTDLNSALFYNPDVIARGWFKWGNWGTFNYTTWNWMAQQSLQQNAYFGGGIGLQALYPGEVDNAKFLRIVERTPRNEPMFFMGDPGSGFYHGDYQNKEYLDFELGWLYQQIDAGASTLFLDGIMAVPMQNTGYSDYSMGEFNKFLIQKYVDQLDWSVNDARWQTIFDISFDLDCTDGTISTFDYRKFLIRNGYDQDPGLHNFALRYEFGDPWNYQGTYSEKRNAEACAYLYTSLKNYSAGKGKEVLVTMNGYSNYTDFQTTGVWNNWKVQDGRLDIAPSYVSQWREIKNYSMINLNRDIPLVVFHDWGTGMPYLDEIPVEDQILWLRVYAPEVFASGGIFAWPASGGGNLYQPSVALRNSIKSLISWYDANRDLYLTSSWISQQHVNLMGQDKLVSTRLYQYDNQQHASKQIVHLINKKLDVNRNLVTRSNFKIRVFSDEEPISVWAASPDFAYYQKLGYTMAGDSAEITINSLNAYTVVVLDYMNKIPQRIHFNELPTLRTGDADYNPGAIASSGLPVSYNSSNQNVATIVNGKIHVSGAGTCTIQASQAGDESYAAAPDVSQSLVVNGVSALPETGTDNIKIFPNPCNEVVYINQGTARTFDIQLFDVLGNLCLDAIVVNNQLDVRMLSPGVYIMMVDGFAFRLIKN
jgi:hypothetical protein